MCTWPCPVESSVIALAIIQRQRTTLNKEKKKNV